MMLNKCARLLFCISMEDAMSSTAAAVQQLFISNSWSLSTAESCTGGALAAHLTQLPGASNYFMGSIVAYSNALKESLLGVPAELLASKGAVSQEVVLAMALGLLRTTQSDFGIAISGIAGPGGGTPEKPVGTVWVALLHQGAIGLISSKGSAERGRSGLNEEGMALAMADKEDRSGEAVAGRTLDRIKPIVHQGAVPFCYQLQLQGTRTSIIEQTVENSLLQLLAYCHKMP
jgi:nicotinamide-nucleotide amidase